MEISVQSNLIEMSISYRKVEMVAQSVGLILRTQSAFSDLPSLKIPIIYQWNFPHKSMDYLSPLLACFRVWFVSRDVTLKNFRNSLKIPLSQNPWCSHNKQKKLPRGKYAPPPPATWRILGSWDLGTLGSLIVGCF